MTAAKSGKRQDHASARKTRKAVEPAKAAAPAKSPGRTPGTGTRKASGRKKRDSSPAPVARQPRRKQEDRSERSRGQILNAALKLFSSFGYHGTSMRDIAEEAQVSTGNVYHQFPDKETIFRTLLEEYWAALAQPDLPLNQALAAGAFPHDLEKLARATKDSVERYRKYVSLIYVDVVEFDGSHIRRFYADMAGRFRAFLDSEAGRTGLDRVRDGVSPLAAVMTATRFFYHYYSVEILFGVHNHFGVDEETALAQTVDILKYGMLKRP